MRKLSLFLTLFLLCLCAQAQQTYSSQQLDLVRKMLRNPSSRKPLPKMMTNDRECEKGIYALEELSTEALHLLSDSMKARYEENEFILPAIKYVVEDTVQRRRTTRSVEHEQLRYKCFTEECSRLERNRQADQRAEPQGELVYVKFDFSGMAHNPRMPMSLEKGEGDKDIAKTGWQETPKEVAKGGLERIRALFSEQHFYQIHPGYFYRRINLPNIPMERVLDGIHWSLTMVYADGTRITSSGEVWPKEHSLNDLERLMNEIIFPESPQ